jgi:quercetin dioxygenase-like cupin family protein
LALLSSDGGATRQRVHSWFSGGEIERQWLEDVLRQSPLAPDQNIRVTDLGGLASLSHHIVRVRFAESLPVHRNHDLTVYVYRRRGVPRLGAGRIRLKEGDVVSIPRETPHAFQSQAPTLVVAVVMFTPTSDGRDAILVKVNECKG